MKKFDLNIEKVLEHWTVPHAVREVIANALDEASLTNTKNPDIFKTKEGDWSIKDYGRGLSYKHLTQNENSQKLKQPDKVIGKFGVGLKDAFATFDRRGIQVIIKSKYGNISISKSPKHGFEDIPTLHAVIESPTDPNFLGTEFFFKGVSDKDMEAAKHFFLTFSDEEILEETRYGSIIKKKGKVSRIFVNGICVAEEENLLFSYNITSPKKKLLQSLNRERSNVGRSAYSDRIKSILLHSESSAVANLLADDLQKWQLGDSHDEMQWVDVQLHACKILNSKEKLIFLTPDQMNAGSKYIDYAKLEGRRVIPIPFSLAGKLPEIKDLDGNDIVDLDTFSFQWNESFEYQFVPVSELTKKEREVFFIHETLLTLFPKSKETVKEILVSETMKPGGMNTDVEGLWDEFNKRIIIKRDQLERYNAFCGVFIHELIHAVTGTNDGTVEFENELTDMIGVLADKLFVKKR
ncbi:ATP-binding protein [Bacillus sp. BRMEA1]|nr:ATP-binding protein [Neobacillus endophyticus]